MFTKKTPEEVFGVMQQYGATHVVLSKSRCFAKSKSGCTMSYIVSIDNPPSNPSNPLFCTLAQQSPLVSKVETKALGPLGGYFFKVFENHDYIMLRVYTLT